MILAYCRHWNLFFCGWYSSSFGRPLESKHKFKTKCQASESIFCFSLISWLKICQSSILRTSGRQMNLRSPICQEQYALNPRTMVHKEHLHKSITCHLEPFFKVLWGKNSALIQGLWGLTQRNWSEESKLLADKQERSICSSLKHWIGQTAGTPNCCKLRPKGALDLAGTLANQSSQNQVMLIRCKARLQNGGFAGLL